MRPDASCILNDFTKVKRYYTNGGKKVEEGIGR